MTVREIRPGYKQTEVGVIPEDWDDTTLGNFIAIRRGHDLTARQRRRGQVPVMGSAGQNGFHDTALASGPGVVIGRSGASFGQAHYCEVDYWPHNTALYVTDFLGNDPRFVFYFLRAMDFSQHNSGGAQQSLNRNFIAPIKIAVPPPEEQSEIVAALADADALIAALEGMITKKRDLKQAAMQHLLTGKTRLPGFSGEWEVKRLGDHVSFLKNGTLSRAQLAIDAPVKYLHYGDIHGSTSLWLRPKSAGMPCVDPELVASLDRLKDGDLIFADASEDLEGVGKSIEIADCIETEVVSGLHTIAARFDKEVLADGFKAYLQFMPPFRDHLRSMAAGTKVLATNRKHIGSAKLALPEPPEQTAIAEVLSDMDADLAALEAQAAKARAVKQGMMQELLTGRVRLV